MCARCGHVQVEYTALNLAYAYATTSGVMRKAAILRHPVAKAKTKVVVPGLCLKINFSTTNP